MHIKQIIIQGFKRCARANQIHISLRSCGRCRPVMAFACPKLVC